MSYPVSCLNAFVLGRAKYVSNGRGRHCSVTTRRTLQVKYTFPLLGELQLNKINVPQYLFLMLTECQEDVCLVQIGELNQTLQHLTRTALFYAFHMISHSLGKRHSSWKFSIGQDCKIRLFTIKFGFWHAQCKRKMQSRSNLHPDASKDPGMVLNTLQKN